VGFPGRIERTIEISHPAEAGLVTAEPEANSANEPRVIRALNV
jgi:hypothetical protein